MTPSGVKPAPCPPLEKSILITVLFSRYHALVSLPEEHHESLSHVAEVVVPLDGRFRVQGDVAEELHAHDGVDEEQHDHQHHDVGQGLDGLHEGEQQDLDAHAPPQQFDESRGPEKPEEAHVDDLSGVDDAAHHRDKVERVPSVLEVGLKETDICN